MEPVRVADIAIGPGRPLVLVAGPCVLEGRDMALAIAESLARTCAALGLPLIFKGSFDKANRTSADSFRGPGLDAGLGWLAEIRALTGLPVTTDVHEPAQASAVAEAVDLLQVPAFLCRQTDLLEACGRTGRPVNIKKGPFLAPRDLAHAAAKVRGAGGAGVLATERGTTFGYHDLVADLRAIPWLHDVGLPVVFDATHAVQRPGGGDGRSGGERRLAPTLARAAVAAGADAIFLEVHPDPARALSDAATQLPLDGLPALLADLVALAAVVRRAGDAT